MFLIKIVKSKRWANSKRLMERKVHQPHTKQKTNLKQKGTV
nr:MAG TPA: hypothetical protein [Caudoviricetes sp.]